MSIRVVKDTCSREELKEIAKHQFGNLVKAVVDIKQGIMAIGGELHADEEMVLSEHESSQREHTWGINLYPDATGDDFVEFDSMINVKPAFGNLSRNVENIETQKIIKNIVNNLVQG